MGKNEFSPKIVLHQILKIIISSHMQKFEKSANRRTAT